MGYLYFHLLYVTYKRGSKKINSVINYFLPSPSEPSEKKKYLSVASWSCERTIHYKSSIFC